jgi:hypothetical protein
MIFEFETLKRREELNSGSYLSHFCWNATANKKKID